MSDRQQIQWPWSLPRNIQRAFRSSKGRRNMKVAVCRRLVEALRAHVACRHVRIKTPRKVASTELESVVEICQTWRWVSPEWLTNQLRRGHA